MKNGEIIEILENRAEAYKQAEREGKFNLLGGILADTLNFIAEESYDFAESVNYTKLFYELRDEE